MSSFARTCNTFQINRLWVERFLAMLPLLVLLVALSLVFMDVATAGMPWEGPLCKVANSLKGPVAKAVAIIAIVISGLMLAVGEVGGVFKTMLGLLAGVSMALLASDWLGFIDSAAGSFNC